MHTHPSAPHTPAPMPTCPSHTHLPLTHLFTHLPAPHIPILTPTCSERWYGLFDRLPPHLMNLLSYLLPHPPAPHTPTLLPAPTSTCSSHTYSHTHLLLTHLLSYLLPHPPAPHTPTPIPTCSSHTHTLHTTDIGLSVLWLTMFVFGLMVQVAISQYSRHRRGPVYRAFPEKPFKRFRHWMQKGKRRGHMVATSIWKGERQPLLAQINPRYSSGESWSSSLP